MGFFLHTGYLSAGRLSGVRALSAVSEQGEQANGQRPDSMKNVLRRYLDEYIEAEQLSVNQLWERLQSEGAAWVGQVLLKL